MVVDSLTEQMRDAWDAGAVGYDDQYGHGLKSELERAAWQLLLCRLLPATARLQVLDVGTGTGLIALLLADLGHDVVALDLSEGMLRIGRTKAEQLGVKVDFRIGDATAPPFEKGVFDAVISRHLLWTLLEPERAVREWVRVTRPGGAVMAIDGLWHSDRLVDRASVQLGRTLKTVFDRARPRRHGYPQHIRGRLPLMNLRSPDPARNVFARSGLREVRSEELTWLDAVERAAMPMRERLANRYRRYLVEGQIPEEPVQKQARAGA